MKSRALLADPVPQPAFGEFPRKLFVETTTRCNLGCFMCVKQAPGCEMSEGELSPANFAALEPAFPHLEALILNGIGEPLLHPRLEEFIARARQLMPKEGWIGFQSNGLLLTNLRAISLVEAGLDRICLSIDGSSPETFSSVREGGELLDVKMALEALRVAKVRCDRPEVRVGIEYVLMRKNLAELPQALRWGAEQGASFAIVTNLLPYEDEYTAEAVYDTGSAETIALFHRWSAEAERQGVDLSRYFDSRWKYARDPEEKRIVDLVDAMKTEAALSGLFIDMKKLLRMKTREHGEVAAIFAEAREVARETGLDLKLPEMVLKEERRCGFVEDGGAFVSWEGNVSPCYYLWHRFRSFASGWRQEVRPKVFGNVAGRGILEIWNGSDFRSFREAVLGYDYPDCSGCSLAPCDYVQTDGFEQDCHIRDVPCGACLWCRGVFQCLQ